MTGPRDWPKGNGEFCFPETLNVSPRRSRGKHWGGGEPKLTVSRGAGKRICLGRYNKAVSQETNVLYYVCHICVLKQRHKQPRSQGLSSSRSLEREKGDGKMKDPGNEIMPLWRHKVFHLCFIMTLSAVHKNPFLSRKVFHQPSYWSIGIKAIRIYKWIIAC